LLRRQLGDGLLDVFDGCHNQRYHIAEERHTGKRHSAAARLTPAPLPHRWSDRRQLQARTSRKH
jgi:hypothetical protein